MLKNWKLPRRATAEGQAISETDARGAITGTGTIWILVISTALAIIALLGLWAFNSRDMLVLDRGDPGSKIHAPATAAKL